MSNYNSVNIDDSSVFEVTGFAELQNKIKQIPDKVKKRELLKILGQVANQTVKAARSQVRDSKAVHTQSGKRSYKRINPGNLRKSIGKIVGRRGQAKVNAVLYVGPRAKGRKNDGWYGMMVHGGHDIVDRKTTRRQRKNAKRRGTGIKSKVAANPFMDRAFAITKGQVSNDAERRIKNYLDRQLLLLSQKGIK